MLRRMTMMRGVAKDEGRMMMMTILASFKGGLKSITLSDADLYSDALYLIDFSIPFYPSMKQLLPLFVYSILPLHFLWLLLTSSAFSFLRFGWHVSVCIPFPLLDMTTQNPDSWLTYPSQLYPVISLTPGSFSVIISLHLFRFSLRILRSPVSSLHFNFVLPKSRCCSTSITTPPLHLIPSCLETNSVTSFYSTLIQFLKPLPLHVSTSLSFPSFSDFSLLFCVFLLHVSYFCWIHSFFTFLLLLFGWSPFFSSFHLFLSLEAQHFITSIHLPDWMRYGERQGD